MHVVFYGCICHEIYRENQKDLDIEASEGLEELGLEDVVEGLDMACDF